QHPTARAALLEVEGPAQGRLARHGGEVQLGGDARCLATRLTHRGRPHPGSRCPALVAPALPQGPLVLHTGHSGRPHPPPVRVRRVGAGRRLTVPTQRNREGAPFRCVPGSVEVISGHRVPPPSLRFPPARPSTSLPPPDRAFATRTPARPLPGTAAP